MVGSRSVIRGHEGSEVGDKECGQEAWPEDRNSPNTRSHQRTAQRTGSNHWVPDTHRVSHVLQRGRERMDQAVRQLGQEANGVHVQDPQARGQQPRVYRDIKSRERLVPRLQSSLTRQSLDECGLPWGEVGETVALSAAQARTTPTLVHPSLLTTVGVSHH